MVTGLHHQVQGRLTGIKFHPPNGEQGPCEGTKPESVWGASREVGMVFWDAVVVCLDGCHHCVCLSDYPSRNEGPAWGPLPLHALLDQSTA